eukprot:CAMPEP_0178427094 /NCGR_PEP_ID=MMETSP0689_2-20121128/29567_1 /TAXON_ID=160604 /ORGANISM="Amphidinium massartii, Strain CS-259" /LENGTH=82 /DNA_ID=CAMNT_0020048789 /DNA_START=65 /DNA_END=313 /DNA_ORIENTATION=+
MTGPLALDALAAASRSASRSIEWLFRLWIHLSRTSRRATYSVLKISAIEGPASTAPFAFVRGMSSSESLLSDRGSSSSSGSS